MRHLKLKEFIKVHAMDGGAFINDENTSNRVEQEMIRTVKDNIRHEFPLKSLYNLRSRLFVKNNYGIN